MTVGELREILRNFEGVSDDIEIVINDPETPSRLIPLEMWGASVVGMNNKNKLDDIRHTNKKVFHIYIG